MVEAALPTCRFHRLFPDAPEPRRADRSADGMMGVRAYRYCEAMASASALGWYVFPPINFGLRLERNSLYWTYEGANGWMKLHGAQFPGFASYFGQIAPEGALPPLFLSASREPGVAQIWPGLIVETQPGCSLLVRSPINIPITQDYEVFEGLIDTDRYAGPTIGNIRLTRTNSDVRFNTEYPLFQIMPIQRQAYANLSSELVDDPAALDWSGFMAATARNRNHPERKPGHYAADSRRQKRRELEPA